MKLINHNIIRFTYFIIMLKKIMDVINFDWKEIYKYRLLICGSMIHTFVLCVGKIIIRY